MTHFFRMAGLIGLLWLSRMSAQAELVTYPASDNIRADNPYIMPSTEYRVELIQAGKPVESFVYQMKAMHYTNNAKTTAWVNFSFSGTVTVRVTRLTAPVSFCQVLPRNRQLTVQQQGQSVTFELTKPGHYSVEFERGIKLTHPLLIFANPLETNIPSPADTNVIYFGPGLHQIGDKYHVPSGKTVYIHGGAYIKGQFYSENSAGITIRGRGILSGEAYAARTADHMISMRNARNIRVEGLTIIHAPRFMITLNGQDHHVQNVKMMGWWFSTDGTSTGENALIEDCFFKVNDDAIKLYSTNTVARNCVIWQMENGAPFQIGWNGTKDFHNCRATNIDVIRVEHEWDNENESVICSVHGASAHKSQFLFDSIRIDNSDWRMVHIVTKPNRWAQWNPEKGSLSDLTFRNIEYYGRQHIPSLVMGHDEKHLISNVIFENVVIDGRKVTGPGTDFIIDAETTRNVRFK